MNKLRNRYLEAGVREDLEQKMVFIGGPRQVGKTTLTRMIAESFRRPAYYNWDNREHRRNLLHGQDRPDTDLLVLDEIHKYPRWKTLIKGIWDTRVGKEQILVTGSSRLDVYRRGGDSLQGRYHYYTLYPFTLRELHASSSPEPMETNRRPELQFPESVPDLGPLLRWGGFPEPLMADRERVWRRWQRERFERVFREDIRDLEAVRTLGQVELLASLLPDRVASPLSVQSLVEDVEASPKTVKAWIELLCRNYYIFRVPPWHRRLERALKKESKYYCWDWSEVRDEGARFENMVAVHLHKWCAWQRESSGLDVNLYYLRDLEKREVDFLVVWEKQPWLLVECKLRPEGALGGLRYFGAKLGLTNMYLVSAQGKDDHVDRHSGVRVIPASRFLMGLI